MKFIEQFKKIKTIMYHLTDTTGLNKIKELGYFPIAKPNIRSSDIPATYFFDDIRDAYKFSDWYGIHTYREIQTPLYILKINASGLKMKLDKEDVWKYGDPWYTEDKVDDQRILKIIKIKRGDLKKKLK